MITLSFIVSNNLYSQQNVNPIVGSINKNITKGRISGKITDAKTGAPLPGATIYFPDLKTGAISDNNGLFTTPALNPGKYLIQITYQGYSTIIENVTIDGNLQKDFALIEAIIESEEVTVTGFTSATRTKQSPQPINIVRRTDFLKTISTNAIDALTKTVPGVSGLTTGPAITKPLIRGLGYNRVVTVNDGVRQEGQQWGDEHGIEIDDYSIQRAEVLKGPASLMYGSDAMAGVINIITQQPVPEATIAGNITGEYQTNSGLRGFNGNLGGTKNGFSWNAYGSYKAAHDYKNKYDGYVFNSKFYEQNFGGMIGYNKSWGHSNLLISNFNQHLGLVEGDRDIATGQFIKALPGGEEAVATNADFKSIIPEVPFQHIRHFKVTSDNAFNIGRTVLDATFGYSHNQRQEFPNADDPNTPGLWFDLQTMNYSVRFHLPYTQNWKTTIGIAGMNQTNKNKGDEVLIPAYDLFDIGGFVFTQYHRDKLSLSGGLRFDNRNLNSNPLVIDNEAKFVAFKRNFSDASGSAGLSYEATKQVTFKFNLARGFRAPTIAELASNGAHEGTIRYEIGDNNLKSETSLQADGGIEISSEHVSFETSIFYDHIKNFIFYEKVLNSQGQDSIITDAESGNEFGVFRFAQKDANLYGAEVSMDIHPHPLDWLHIKNTFSYTRGQFTETIDGSKNIPFIPAARLYSNLGVNLLPKGKMVRNLFINLESDYTFNQVHPFTGYSTETGTSSYWLINAGVGSDFVAKNGKKLFSLYITGMNLTDIAYQDFLSRLRYAAENNVSGRTGVFNMGRNFAFKINVPLDFKM